MLPNLLNYLKRLQKLTILIKSQANGLMIAVNSTSSTNSYSKLREFSIPCVLSMVDLLLKKPLKQSLASLLLLTKLSTTTLQKYCLPSVTPSMYKLMGLKTTLRVSTF
jgi:hypothetical protein